MNNILTKLWLHKCNHRILMFKKFQSTIATLSDKVKTSSSDPLYKVLGIESTCDDTCASVVTSDRQILSDVRYSQAAVHVNRGGIVPTTARIGHARAINEVVKQALDSAGLTINDIDAIAVSHKPGLILSLQVGVDYAKRLAVKYSRPLIGIHHMEAHALTAHLAYPDIEFPFLALLISGGHTMLTLAKNIDEYYLLSESNSTPVGENMDKLARTLKIKLLGFPYDSACGGRQIELLAEKGNPMRFSNIPFIGDAGDFNFAIQSLRGYWDQVINKFKLKHPDHPVDCPLPEVADIAAGLQRSIVLHLGIRINRIVKYLEATDLVNKVNKENYNKLKTDDISHCVDYVDPKPIKMKLVVSGGVACNKYIVDKLKEYCGKMITFYDETKIEVIAPSPRHLSTDNGVMIAWNGILKLINRTSNDDGNCSDGVLLRNKEDIESLEAIYEAQLGVDIRHLIDTMWVDIKTVNV